MVTLQYFITNYMIHVLDTKDVLSILKKKEHPRPVFFHFQHKPINYQLKTLRQRTTNTPLLQVFFPHQLTIIICVFPNKIKIEERNK